MPTKTKDASGRGFKTVKGKVEFDGKNLKVNGQIIPMKSISMDGWASLLTGLGIRDRDKRMSGVAQYNGALLERQAEEVYASDPMARRIVNLLPFEAVREWIEFHEKEIQQQTDDEVDRLQAKKKCIKAWQWAKLYGGAGIFINTGEPLEMLKEPLDIKNIKEVKSLLVFNRYELQVSTSDIETDISNPNFDMPMHYDFTPRSIGGVTSRIHESRIIRFDGVELPTLLRVSNQYWGDSVYTGLYDALRDFGISYASVAHLIQEFRMLVYSVENLAQDIVAGNSDAIAERMNLMNLSRNNLGAFVIDKNGETMDSMSATVTGLDKLLEAIRDRLQAATDIPHTILFNESPSGLSATGKSEERMWYDYVSSQQEQYLAEKLDRILQVIFAAKSGPFKGAEPKNWGYDFVPLWQMSDKERAEVDKLNMETDSGYIDRNVVNAAEVREERKPHLEQLEITSGNPADAD
jgi:uncharacterized protein